MCVPVLHPSSAHVTETLSFIDEKYEKTGDEDLQESPFFSLSQGGIDGGVHEADPVSSAHPEHPRIIRALTKPCLIVH